MLESIDSIDWGAFSQPDWNGRDHVPLAIRALAGATTEAAATEAYHRLLYALGNDHAGTYYPVVLPVVPFMQEIVERGTAWARIRALDILIDLGRFLLVSLVLYVAVKFQDLFARGVVHYLFLPRTETLFFWAEILLLLIPMFLLMSLRVRVSSKGIFVCACMVILGVVLNRLNVSIIGLYNYTGVRYIPSFSEVFISIFLITLGVVVFSLAVKYLNIFADVKNENHRHRG
jgi:Ni/Fe-hydrogenase subunit HybB-like protein